MQRTLFFCTDCKGDYKEMMVPPVLRAFLNLSLQLIASFPLPECCTKEEDREGRGKVEFIAHSATTVEVLSSDSTR